MSSRMLFNAGLVDYSGHISVRIPGSDHLLILPHPVSRATVKPDDMVITDFEGKVDRRQIQSAVGGQYARAGV